MNGKKVKSSEYGVDFNVLDNPRLIHHFPFAFYPSTYDFYVNRPKLGYLSIPLFRYLSIPDSIAKLINSGKGFMEDHYGNNFYPHTDVFRTWYITRPGTTILLPVSRKEFLESLLEFYDREKLSLIHI